MGHDRKCFYVPGSHTIIDTAVDADGRLVGLYSKEPLELIQKRYPRAELWEFDAAIKAATEAEYTHFHQEPARIDEVRYTEMLEVLPPLRYGSKDGVTHFAMPEAQCGMIYNLFFTHKGWYWEATDYLSNITQLCAAIKEQYNASYKA